MPCIINTALQLFGRLAQLVEHLLDVQRVSGSIPLASTKKDPNLSVIGDGFGFFVLVFYVSGIKQASSARRHVWDAALFPCPHPLCIKSNCDLAQWRQSKIRHCRNYIQARINTGNPSV